MNEPQAAPIKPSAPVRQSGKSAVQQCVAASNTLAHNLALEEAARLADAVARSASLGDTVVPRAMQELAQSIRSMMVQIEPSLAHRDFQERLSATTTRVVDAAFWWAESREVGPTPAKEALQRLILTIKTELVSAEAQGFARAQRP